MRTGACSRGDEGVPLSKKLITLLNVVVQNVKDVYLIDIYIVGTPRHEAATTPFFLFNDYHTNLYNISARIKICSTS